MYSMYDVKAVAFITPWFVNNTNMALRAIRDAGTDPKHMFAKHPEDYALHHLGSWDDVTCVLTMHDQPQNLGLVSQIVDSYDLLSIVPEGLKSGAL